MLYLLFHDLRHLGLVIGSIALVLSFITGLGFLLTAGASIRTSAEGGKPSRFSAGLRLIMVFTFSLAIIALFSYFLGERAIQRAGAQGTNAIMAFLVGPATVHYGNALRFGLFMLGAVFMLDFLLINQTKQGSGLRLWLDQFRGIRRRQDLHGSSHFATVQEYRRFRRNHTQGINLYGRFMGQKTAPNEFTYLGEVFSLSAEDTARGLITIGNPGSGKSASVILPILFDSMRLKQNLVVADPQKELTAHIVRYAVVSGHRVIIHDPTNPKAARYNLAAGVKAVTDARTVADVLIPKGTHGDSFWTDSAEMLLAACLLRFENVGEIFSSFGDLRALAQKLGEKPDDAQRLGGSFISSALGDGKLASNVVATLATSLMAWADEQVRQSTAASDFSAEDLVDPEKPTVVILVSPGQARDVIAPYLGAVLTKLVLDLDTIGEGTETGALAIPVKFIIDEFPALGDLNSIVNFANLVRKRQIAFLLACQTLGQLENIYGKNGAETLLAGMATQIIFGGCDQRTAEYYSAATGQSTAKESASDGTAKDRQRRLLTPDEIVRPPTGNCLISTRYVEAEYATYAFILARLTRIYERKDVKAALDSITIEQIQANLMPRGRAEILAAEAHKAAELAASAGRAIIKEEAEKIPLTQAEKSGKHLVEPLGTFR